MQYVDLKIENMLGLHARGMALFVTINSMRWFSEYEIFIGRDSRVVEGRSVMGVMSLAAAKGAVVRISSDMPDVIWNKYIDLLLSIFVENENHNYTEFRNALNQLSKNSMTLDFVDILKQMTPGSGRYNFFEMVARNS